MNKDKDPLNISDSLLGDTKNTSTSNSSKKIENNSNLTNLINFIPLVEINSINFLGNLVSDSSKGNQKPNINSKKKGVTSTTNKTNKGDVVSVTYEEIGLWPRSFSRVLDRFLKQVFSDVENLVIQEYRFYRYLFLTTVRCLCILFFVPFIVNFFAKNYLIHPLTEYFWNTQQNEIFLNSYQQKHAFAELKEFEEKLYFESFIPSNSTFGLANNIKVSSLDQTSDISHPPKGDTLSYPTSNSNYFPKDYPLEGDIEKSTTIPFSSTGFKGSTSLQDIKGDNYSVNNSAVKTTSVNELILVSPETRQGVLVSLPGVMSSNLYLEDLYKQKLQEKTIEIATHYNDESIEAITNFFADLLSFLTLIYLLLNLEIQINITKSFLLEVFFGLDDSKKSLLILLVTDLLVGYHSSNLWELFFEFIFHHYGLPESQTGIFLLVATLPVLLDVLFKYLIFRHLNRSSPATVATYHAMIE